MIDLEQKEIIPEGTLEVENTCPQQLYNQFYNWMLIQDVELTAKQKQLSDSSDRQTNISREILNYIGDVTESSYDKCFGKASFDKGGAFGKGGYSKKC